MKYTVADVAKYCRFEEDCKRLDIIFFGLSKFVGNPSKGTERIFTVEDIHILS
jgi:hypothetical protein